MGDEKCEHSNEQTGNDIKMNIFPVSEYQNRDKATNGSNSQLETRNKLSNSSIEWLRINYLSKKEYKVTDSIYRRYLKGI